VYYEPVADNEYLQDFYGDIKKYSFAMQVYLLNRRFQQQQQIIWAGAGGVQVSGNSNILQSSKVCIKSGK